MMIKIKNLGFTKVLNFLEENGEEVAEQDVLEEPAKDEPGSQHQVSREAARDPKLPEACLSRIVTSFRNRHANKWNEYKN